MLLKFKKKFFLLYICKLLEARSFSHSYSSFVISIKCYKHFITRILHPSFKQHFVTPLVVHNIYFKSSSIANRNSVLGPISLVVQCIEYFSIQSR